MYVEWKKCIGIITELQVSKYHVWTQKKHNTTKTKTRNLKSNLTNNKTCAMKGTGNISVVLWITYYIHITGYGLALNKTTLTRIPKTANHKYPSSGIFQLTNTLWVREKAVCYQWCGMLIFCISPLSFAVIILTTYSVLWECRWKRVL